MSRYQRIPGGEKNKKTGQAFSREELEQISELYLELAGKGIHERNPKVQELASKQQRTIRSVENQLLGFRAVDTKRTGRKHTNTLITRIWKEKKIEKLPFKISSALKNIIGRDLITDDLIAIFELVKNSYDAYAQKVKIIFERDKITIEDDGKGMDKKDILDKWLFVAYSAKKLGVEDKDLEKKELQDYREKIRPRNYYAGAKGVGRFSCDRLGHKLILVSKKVGGNVGVEQLIVDWDQFEENPKDQFIDIKVFHRTLNRKKFSDLKYGTRLEISGLRSRWERKNS